MNLLRWLSEIRTPVTEKFFLYVTDIGGEIIIVAFACYMFWFVSKRAGQRICMAYFTSGLLVQTIKITARVKRPWLIDENFKPVEAAVEGATGYSFPSGHTQSSASVFGSAAAIFKNKAIKTFFVVLIILVGFSRMFLGVHTPYDVAGGIFFAICGIVISGRFIKEDKEIKPAVYITLFAASAAAFIYSYVLCKNGIVDIANSQDCCKSAGAAAGFAISLFIDEKYTKYKVPSVNAGFKAVLFIAGVAVIAAAKVLIKIIFPKTLIADAVRYMILVFIYAVFYPAIIQKVVKKQEGKTEG